MLKKYDFRAGVQGKYAKRYKQGTNVIDLNASITKALPKPKSAHYPVRALAAIFRRPLKRV